MLLAGAFMLWLMPVAASAQEAPAGQEAQPATSTTARQLGKQLQRPVP